MVDWLNAVTQPFFADWPLWAIVVLCTTGFMLWFGTGLWAGVKLIENLINKENK